MFGNILHFVNFTKLTFSSVGKAIAGTTDSATELTHTPSPKEEDIRFILHEIKNYLSPDISGRITAIGYMYMYIIMMSLSVLDLEGVWLPFSP